MAEVKVTVGVDSTEMNKGLEKAGKDAAKSFGKGGEMPLAFVGLESLFKLFDRMTSFFVDAARRARELRDMSNATGIDGYKLSELRAIAERSGVAFSDLAHSMAEFNKRMGELRIKGGEAFGVITKMGYGIKDVADGSFNAEKAMMELAKAYDAGTDATTLAYYGTQLFGSSFERLLPLLKQGAINIEKYGDSVVKTNDKYARSLVNAGDILENTLNNIKNGLVSIAGSIALVFEDMFDEVGNLIARFEAMMHSYFVGNEQAAREYAQAVMKQMSAGKSKEEQQKYFEYYGRELDDESRKAYEEEVKKMMSGEGKKLTPVGLMTADAASQMQQMGGGDIFGAVAFSPLQNIEKNTERAADSLDKMASKQPESQSRETSPSIFQGPPL